MKTSKKDKGKKATKYKKAPDAPKRFKSAFIIFSAEKHKVIKKDLLEDGKTVRTTEIAKMVSEAWKGLDPDKRKEWEDKADRDKQRYEAEKAIYKGPWKIPSNKRKTKDPAAPKRPMSAFLAYSNSRRAALKREHPKSTNADLSRMLSKSWKELPPTERAVYMAEERKLRDQYKTDMSEWRKKVAEDKKVEREEREVAALQAAETGQAHQLMEHEGMASSTGAMDSKWIGSASHRQQEELRQQQQFQQQAQQNQQHIQQNHAHDAQQQQQNQQLSDMTSAGMFANSYFQAAAFGGNTSLGVNAATPSSNTYLANAFSNQGYMQGMQGAGNAALSLFGTQAYSGIPGQFPPSGLYGSNFSGMPGMNEGGVPGSGYGQIPP